MVGELDNIIDPKTGEIFMAKGEKITREHKAIENGY